MSDQVSVPSSAPAASSAPTSSTSSAPSTPSSGATPQPSQATSQTSAQGGQQSGQHDPHAGHKPQGQQQETAAQKQARLLRLKVDQQEMELPEEEVIKLAQLGRASSQRFQEAARMRKEAEQFVQMLKTNPLEVLKNPAIGLDVRKFAEEFLANELKREQMSPEQRQIQELQEKLAKEEQEKKSFVEQKQREEFQKLQDHYAQDFEAKITDALQKGGLPKTPKTIYRMADYMTKALENGVELEPADVMNLVRQDYLAEIKELFDQTPGDALLQLLGDGVANKIRKADLARLKAAVPAPSPAPKVNDVPSDATNKTPTRQYKNVHEWRAELDKRVRGS